MFPCSILTPFINYVIGDSRLQYVGASSEGEAVGIAVGAHLGGHKPVVICQNSGFGNMVNPLTSLNRPFEIPSLLIVTYRGEPGRPDEPQHEFMGPATPRLFDALEIPWRMFPEETKDIEETLIEADDCMTRRGRPFALLMRKGAVAPHPLERTASKRVQAPCEVEGSFTRQTDRMKRSDAIRVIRERLPKNTLVLGTTGKTGRELYSAGHRASQLYVVGGMGCASGIGLGLSLTMPGRKVAVLDGDGAALMKMGTFATIGHQAPKGLLHILLDNEVHDSTGGQATASTSVDFAQVASACSYRHAYRCDTERQLASVLRSASTQQGPILIHVKTAPGSPADLARPKITPVEVKQQFMAYAASGVVDG